MVGHRSSAGSPRAAKQVQDKHLHSAHWNRSNVVLKSSDLQSLEKAQVWLPLTPNKFLWDVAITCDNPSPCLGL